MTTMPSLRDILNDTAADATDVEWNFNTIETFVGTELINRDGSVAMVGPLTLAAEPTNSNEAATKSYVDAIVPVGVMLDWPVLTIPAEMANQWVFARGQVLTTADYPVLAARYGTSFNLPGDSFGGTQFRVPDMRRRSTVGYHPSVAPFNVIGDTGVIGYADAQLPAHSHTQPNHSHSMNHGHSAPSTGGQSDNHTHGSGGLSTGGAGAHDHNFGNNTTFAYAFSGGGFAIPFGAGWASTLYKTEGNHTHSVNGNTGSASNGHTHSVSVNNFSGSTGNANPSTNSTGVDETNRNYSPSVIVNVIIKAR